MSEYYNVVDSTFTEAVYNALIYPVLKVELLDYFENAYDEVTQDLDRGNAGSININYQQGVRRSCEITVRNDFKKYYPNANGRIWFNTKFKVYTGLKILKGSKSYDYLINNSNRDSFFTYNTPVDPPNFLFSTKPDTLNVDYDTYWFSQGVFVLTNPEVLHELSNSTVTLSGVDKFGLLGSETSFHELEGTYKVPMGTTVKNCIKDTLSLSIGNSQNYPIDPIEPFIDSSIIDWTYGFIGDGTNGEGGKIFHLDSCDTSAAYQLEVYVNDLLKPSTAYTFNNITGVLTFQTAPVADSEILCILKIPVGELTLPYDIEKSPNEYYADIFTELGNVFSCDVYYDANGVFNFVKGNQKKDFDYMTSEWNFSTKDNNFFTPQLSVDFTSMFNVVKVVGTNESASEVCDYTIENRDFSSPTCIQLIGKKIKYVESNFCYNQARTRDFAKYLMKKYSMVEEVLTFSTVALPQLDVNKIITITDDNFGWNEQRFIIQSITIPLTTEGQMEIEASNIANIPFYEY